MQIRVTAKPLTFRRAGLAFSRTPRIIDAEDLSGEQLLAITAEPNLNVALLITADELQGHSVEELAEQLQLPAALFQVVETAAEQPDGEDQGEISGDGSGQALPPFNQDKPGEQKTGDEKPDDGKGAKGNAGKGKAAKGEKKS